MIVESKNMNENISEKNTNESMLKVCTHKAKRGGPGEPSNQPNNKRNKIKDKEVKEAKNERTK